MNYLECAGADHLRGAVWSLPEALRWARDRIERIPLQDVCVQGPPTSCSLGGLYWAPCRARIAHDRAGSPPTT